MSHTLSCKPGPTLYLLCGKIAAGKSTLAAALAREANAVIVSEDVWLARLYGPEMTEVADYVRFAARLREAMTPHLTALLDAGLSLVLDFPANTPQSRAWMKTLIDASGAAHELHWLDVPDAVCLARLRRRNQQGGHDFAATDAQFAQVTRYFVPPRAEEGFNIVAHREAPDRNGA
ncbi:AAA family ATPase [Cronobacter dublinensis]|uniref:AAA family ATPase n=1 Tax=Cronobacter dublinensis TaxID=413497 RepID=UPI00137593AC|nr:ATP-binding protein [Cronobacter dublinensis]EKY3089335.1 ATP-binding protein [Cronobacter dublinensis]ELQ6227723.1 ATP-binding protein [Cronobacter dublinensis]ELY4004012.1 ATP-binding protein [Cronobacter dublinensis]ELY4408308.1 ATP-binding protein [Cronobacter dublinensis]ELY5819405.1 ATP-binding protein [Cronobacter dublinensis]